LEGVVAAKKFEPIQVDEKAAAELLGYGLTKFRELKIPCIKHGRSKRYRIAVLHEWAINAESQTECSTKAGQGSPKPRKSTRPETTSRRCITEILAHRRAVR
jgi:hypothetical protein